MSRLKKDIWILLLDVVAVNLAYLLALVFRVAINDMGGIFGSAYDVPAYFSVFYRFAPIYTLLCIVVFFLFRLYGGIWRFAGINDMYRILGAWIVTTILQVVVSCLAIAREFPDAKRRAFDVRKVLLPLFDEDSTYEVKSEFATNIVTMFARIEGRPFGIIANQSLTLAGCIDIDAADKAAGFIRICDSFNIPIVTFVDVPGFLPGSAQEHRGIIRHGAKMLYAYSEATVLKITIIIRKGYGGAYLAMCSKELGADMVYAWPEAEMAVMGAEAAVDVLFRKDDSEAKKERLREYETQFLNPDVAVHMGYVDEIIEPYMTRVKIANVLDAFGEQLSQGFHGNIPL